jgi:hypothetical protein
VNVRTSDAVAANDLHITKSVQPAGFEAGGLATYTLDLVSSE